MPYFIEGNCVFKGTRDNPGKKLKCYTGSGAKVKARSYLAALYANVEDSHKSLCFYKEDDEDRWIAVTTAYVWDGHGERFTKEAMDYDIAYAHRTNDFPELRAFHVRGFKVGKCDTMERIGIWAADQGYWYKTPFPQAWKELVMKDTDNKWRMSRGFHTVGATGLCPSCDAGLMVKLVNFILGVVRCKECGEWVRTRTLKQFQQTKAVTYDLTLTDIPAVVQTAVAAFTIKARE